MIRVLVLRTAGTNCDVETEYGFNLAGGTAERVHINRILEGSVSLSDYAIVVIPGGFSYGDDLSAGKVLANELRFKMQEEFYSFAESGRPIIGICNGFQVLVKSGLLPFSERKREISATLTFNDSGHFEDRWVFLRCSGRSALVEDLRGEIITLPVAHGEGKFLTKEKGGLSRLKSGGQIAFQYAYSDGRVAFDYPYNPNGSWEAIAAVTNERGNILGMMPHPERFLFPYCHPGWTRGMGRSVDGLRLLKSIVKYVK